MIEQAAESADLSPDFVADVERRRSLADRMLGNLVAQRSTPRPSIPGDRALPTDADLRELIKHVLTALSNEGSVVIVSHAAAFALAGGDVLRVLVTAPLETRAERIAAETGADLATARRRAQSDDLGRADYLKRFYGVERELPTHFDVVVNTEVLSSEAAAEIIVTAAS